MHHLPPSAYILNTTEQHVSNLETNKIADDHEIEENLELDLCHGQSNDECSFYSIGLDCEHHLSANDMKQFVYSHILNVLNNGTYDEVNLFEYIKLW